RCAGSASGSRAWRSASRRAPTAPPSSSSPATATPSSSPAADDTSRGPAHAGGSGAHAGVTFPHDRCRRRVRGDRALFYDHVATGVDGDVEFYVAEAIASGSPVLELGCGTGRILIPVAEAGIDIVGLDASADMLAIAGEKLGTCPPDVHRRVRLIHGDMREFDLGRA